MDKTAGKQEQLEGEVFFPAPEFLETAHVKEYESLYQQSILDPQKLNWSGTKSGTRCWKTAARLFSSGLSGEKPISSITPWTGM
jgi:hypothetical protein